MPTDLREFYRVLELSPGASLDEIKRSYRQLLQRWHPDRYKPGSVMQTTAEDVTKELNEAYNQLCRQKRYLEFRPKPKPARGPVKTGTTRDPWRRARQGWKVYQDPPPPPREMPRRERPGAPPASPPPPPPPEPPPQAKPPEPVPEKPGPRQRAPLPWRALAVTGLVAVTVFFCGRWLESFASTNTLVPTFANARAPTVAPRPRAAGAPRTPTVAAHPPAAAPAQRATKASRPEPVFAAPAETRWVAFAPPKLHSWSSSSVASFEPGNPAMPATRFMPRKTGADFMPAEAWSLLDTFVPGDTKARVIAVQGVPDEAGVNVFRYGSSLVYFEDGRVKQWSDGRPPLRVLVLPRFDFNGLARFSVGATRAEVIRIQGEPTQTTAGAFYYGASAVYFDRDWVTGWSEVDQPLRARPTPAAAAATFAAP
jgi:hypothetical protein